jgi:hypothetical protein
MRIFLDLILQGVRVYEQKVTASAKTRINIAIDIGPTG